MDGEEVNKVFYILDKTLFHCLQYGGSTEEGPKLVKYASDECAKAKSADATS